MARDLPAASTFPPALPSPNGKRSREAEDEVYLDNFHSQKRYLSELMATSLNGLTVGDSLAANIIVSPAQSESCPRDELSLEYSPMSEDSNDSRYCETPIHTSILQSETTSCPTSPVSPQRHRQPSPSGPSAPNFRALPSCSLPSVVACSHPRLRWSESEGSRFPSSPNDVSHTADLRRAALMRSVQMRTQPNCPSAYELSFGSGQGGEELEYIEDCQPVQECPSEPKLGKL